MRTQLVYTIFAASLGTITVSYLSYYLIRRKRQQKPPKNANWKLVGNLEEIAIYPVTSGAAILLKDVKCGKLGLEIQGLRDRSLIVYDDKGKSAFAGTYPQMLGITTEVLDNRTIVLRAPNVELLTLNLDVVLKNPEIVKQKNGFKMFMVECNEEHHKWFSKVILNKSEGLKLFLCRNLQLQYNFLGEDKSDYIPVMVMNNKSVKHLNQLLLDKNRVHHLQFRGNVLINSLENVEPYEEDNWRWLKIGDDEATSCVLRYERPCLRCILPNINIKTFERNPDFEPLKTMNKYRKVHNSKEPTMGAYFKVYQEGSFNLNDPVYVLYR